MKKLILSLFVCAVCSQQYAVAQDLRSEALFDLQIGLNTPQVVGPVLKGMRLITPFRDGRVVGDKFNGKVLACSGDWGLVIDSTTFRVDSRLTIQADDGAIIYMAYSGYSHADAKVAAMIGAGKVSELSPSAYYFRTSVSFETSSPRYAWLNYTIGIGVGSFPAAGQVAYRIYAIR
jgi:hypothetical protein